MDQIRKQYSEIRDFLPYRNRMFMKILVCVIPVTHNMTHGQTQKVSTCFD